jgi:hypothetical protein
MSLPIARSNNDTADEGSSPVIKARRNVQEMADRIANQLYVSSLSQEAVAMNYRKRG